MGIEESIDDYKHIIVLGGFIFIMVVLSETFSKQLPLYGELFGFKATYIYIAILAAVSIIFWKFYFPKAEQKQKKQEYGPPKYQPIRQIQPPEYQPPIQIQPIQPLKKREPARPIFPDEPKVLNSS